MRRLPAFVATLGQAGERHANRQMGRRLRRRMRLEAQADAAAASPLAADAEARIWAAVAAEIAVETRRRPAPPRPSAARRALAAVTPVFPWAATLMSTALALAIGLYSGLPGRRAPPARASLAPEASVQGLKDAGSNAVAAAVQAAQLKGLRYAVVAPDGRLDAGEPGRRLRVGAVIVFAVEADGVDARRPLVVDLWLTPPAGPPRRIIAGQRLQAARETLTGPRGYLAFTLAEPGRHLFRVVPQHPPAAVAPSGDPTESIPPPGDAHAASFSIDVGAP